MGIQLQLSGLRKQKTWLQEHFFAYAAHYHAENRGISKWSTNGGTSARKPTEMCSEISKSFRTEANHNLKNRLYMRRLFN
ncbi:Cadherin-24 [Trichinella pseudospiralis]